MNQSWGYAKTRNPRTFGNILLQKIKDSRSVKKIEIIPKKNDFNFQGIYIAFPYFAICVPKHNSSRSELLSRTSVCGSPVLSNSIFFKFFTPSCMQRNII